MKFATLYDGEKAIIINRNGEVKYVDGPKRFFLFMKKMEKLRKVIADLNEYLVVKHLNGEIEHIAGPVLKWHDRFLYHGIEVKSAFKLNDSQLIVVYNRDRNTKHVERRLVHGPCIFVPSATEWLHEFKWHSQDPSNVGHLIKNGERFHILTTKPDFFHYNVKEVRTVDDTLLTIKLMLIYELAEITTMLDKTQDPLSDFANAICADVISFAAKLTFSEFLQQSSKLNEIDTYEQLKQRAERCGFNLESIIYNGYISSPELQAIQDKAIESRTQMRLNTEIEKQNNELIDLRLGSEKERLEIETNLKNLKSKFEEELSAHKAKFELERLEDIHANDIEINEIEKNIQNEIKTLENQMHEEYLTNLQDLGVDVNDYQLELLKSKNIIDCRYEIIN